MRISLFEVLYRFAANEHQGRYDIRLEDIFRKAQSAGIPERADYRQNTAGFSSLTHLYNISDSNDALPHFQLNGVAEGPRVFRFSENTREISVRTEGGALIRKDRVRPSENLMLILSPQAMSSEAYEEQIQRAATAFREALQEDDPRGSTGVQPVVIGVDDYVIGRLGKLSAEGGFENEEFKRLWDETNSYMHGKMRATLEKIYDTAGVTADLHVGQK